MPEISVNLATHNRAAFLDPCLVSLCEQTLDPARYEICVIANACTDTTPDVVASVAARYPHHRIFMVTEPLPGLSRARNCGLRATTSQFLAHVDDDGTVSPDWLERTIGHFARLGPDVAVVGGEIEPVWGAPKPDWLTEKMQWFLSAGSGHGREARFLTHDECASEGNSTHRRAALVEAGGFPEELGRAGQLLLSGEQVVESTIRKNGGKIFYDPQIVLHHYIHADRLHPQWLRRRMFWQGVSSFAIRQYQIRHGIPVTEELLMNLPLEAKDWVFVERDTPNDLEQSMFYFHSLGLALALSGIIPVES
jgi:glycosyltransferase involved in cell wall biosynthesis